MHSALRSYVAPSSMLGVPAWVVDTVASLYQGSTVRVRTRDEYTEDIPMLGSTAGLPLEPPDTLLPGDPLVRSAEESVAGFEVYGERVTALAYADDLGWSPRTRTAWGGFCVQPKSPRGRWDCPSTPVSVQRCTWGREDSRRPSNSRASICPY